MMGRLLCWLGMFALALATARIDTVAVAHSHCLRCPCFSWELVRYQYGSPVDTLRVGSVSRFKDAAWDSITAKHFFFWGEDRCGRTR